MTGLNFKIDETKCVHCGLCEKDCITKVFTFDRNGFPRATNEQNCIGCQHCMSICPAGAISVFDKNPENASKPWGEGFNSEMILNLIQSRRSCRQYKNQNVDAETMNKLKYMLNFPPTGCNYKKLQFSIIDNVKVMNEFRNHTNEKLKKILSTAPVKALTEKFSKYKDAIFAGEDIIFRGAPHMIVASNSVKAPCAREDAVIALSYFELYANSLGLGTCWCGYAQALLNAFPELCEFLDIKDGYLPGYVMLFGPKNVNYPRNIQPDNANIKIIDKKSVEKATIGQKLKRYFWNFVR